MSQYPKPVSKECTEKILSQIDNSICKIKGNNETIYIGLLCYIKFQDKKVYLLITKYQIINEAYLDKNNIVKVSLKKRI